MAVATASSCAHRPPQRVSIRPRLSALEVEEETHLLGRRVVPEPRPARALDAERRRVERLLEAVEAAKVLLDLVGERARRGELAAAVGRGREVLPEERLRARRRSERSQRLLARSGSENRGVTRERTWLMWPVAREEGEQSQPRLRPEAGKAREGGGGGGERSRRRTTAVELDGSLEGDLLADVLGLGGSLEVLGGLQRARRSGESS